MRVKLRNALVILEKAAAVVAIVVPAVRGVASIMGVNLAETKWFLSNVGAHGLMTMCLLSYWYSEIMFSNHVIPSRNAEKFSHDQFTEVSVYEWSGQRRA